MAENKQRHRNEKKKLHIAVLFKVSGANGPNPTVQLSSRDLSRSHYEVSLKKKKKKSKCKGVNSLRKPGCILLLILGPLPSLFGIIDYYSRSKEIEIMKSISTQDNKSVEKNLSRTGNPTSIIFTDNGRPFGSKEFKTFLYWTRKYFNTITYQPQQNGEVEKQNRDILKQLRISQCENQKIESISTL